MQAVLPHCYLKYKGILNPQPYKKNSIYKEDVFSLVLIHLTIKVYRTAFYH